MSVVKEINAREMLDSRKNPAAEVDARREDGSFGRAMVPSGASAGEHEALELRDGDGNRHGGKGVLRAVRNTRDEVVPSRGVARVHEGGFGKRAAFPPYRGRSRGHRPVPL